MNEEELLLKYGFKTDSGADQEEMEQAKDQIVKTSYPTPKHRYRLVHESYQQSIEESYYFVLDQMQHNWGYAKIDKIIDTFTASEHSAFFGVAQQRVGLQQDKVSQFLATVGKMVKELFQLVRELRVLDERLSYYEDSFTESKSSESAEITLKGIYIDMVEGGAKNPASIYGMARELQFTTLPDLFFSTHPKTAKEVDETVEKLDFNRKVREVLKRKLRSYLEWKEHTYKELKTRRTFTLKYLRQHYDVIKMYMTWIKPYLRNIRRLQNESMEEKKKSSPDLISAFEGSLVEIEILGKHLPENNKDYYSVFLANFNYRTKPSMSYQQEGYQRGPLHVGQIKLTLRGYTWTEEQIESYKKMRDQEDFELLGLVDGSVKAAMEALGDELENYLAEAGDVQLTLDKMEKHVKEEEPERPGIFDPFTSVFKGFGELFGGPLKKSKKKPVKRTKTEIEEEKERAEKFMKTSVWNIYKNYKKANKMLHW